MNRKNPKRADRVETEGMADCRPTEAGCEAGVDAFPPPDGGGAADGLTGGRGGSTTSDASRRGYGAWAGGCACLAMSCNRPPAWTGCM